MPVRVLVVEDSLTVRKRLLEVLAADPDIEIVGDCDNGRRGFELCQQLRPDVVTLDMMMPVMTGVEATELIMAHCPTPILIVSASVNRGELFRTYDALAAGAIDCLDKPDGQEDTAAWERTFLRTVKLVARIKVIMHPRGKLSAAKAAKPPAPERRVVAMGVSTGGPGAIRDILTELPADFPLPILLVLHLSATFASAFAAWLDPLVSLRVRYAEDGEPLPGYGTPGVWMAPADKHLIVKDNQLRLTTTPERHSCRPSVDELFESVAQEIGSGAVGCLLTGMGRDGAEGLLEIRHAGGATFAQDEATSVVFGMPREAILLGAAERVVPLDRVASTLMSFASTEWRKRP